MPRQRTKKAISIRLDEKLMAEVRGLAANLTEAIEEGLRLWLKREQRRVARQQRGTD